MLNRLMAWELHHVYREQNWLSDAMAKEGLKQELRGELKVFVDPPLFI